MAETFSSVRPVELKCEYKISPAGIDETNPRLSWITNYDGVNSFQSAYRIIVFSSLTKNGDIWDSNKVLSSDSNIQYPGEPLQSNHSYHWHVMIWNEKDEASSWSETAEFSTGLFRQDEWKGKWISHLYEQNEDKSVTFHAGVDKWIWFPFSNTEDKYRSIILLKTFKLNQIQNIETAELIVTADEKFRLWINEKFTAKSDDKIFSWARPHLLNVKDLLKEGTNQIRAEGSNSYVDKPGFILHLEIRYRTGEIIFINTDNSWETSIDGNSDLISAKVSAIAGEKPWRLPKAGLSFNPAAYFRKAFVTSKKIKRAFIYSAALGLYNLQVDGRQAGDFKFSPVWSDFSIRTYYNTFDVTSIMTSSMEHTIDVILADGYYSGYCGWEKGRGYYGKYPAFILQLMITYEDLSEEIIITDETWLSSEGPIREADILMGEFYDSSYDNSNYEKVKVLSGINTELTSYKADQIKSRLGIKPKLVTKLGDKKFIVDFGQNFAGFVRLHLRNAVESKVVLRFAEMLNDGGTLYTENIRMARAQDTYISKGDSEEIWEPKFTYHGFRYVEVSGLPMIDKDTITGISINSLPEQTGFFTSSDPKLNKLFECILWNQRSNYIDIPTDCPQRDERFGWTGDAVSYFRTAAFNYDVSAFYNKWLIDLFDTQKNDGALPPFAPLPDMGVGPVFFSSAGWGDAGVITPFMFYQFYNDKELLSKYYNRMKLFLASLEKQSNNYILPDYGYGDWLYMGEEASKSLIATAYFAHDSSLMKKIASLFGYLEEERYYDYLFKQIKKSFREAFLSKVQITQTSAVLAIYFELLEPEERKETAEYLIKDIREKNFHTTCGFLGLSFIMPVLSSLGRNDIAWKLLTNSEFPSWFFMIDNGATTLWERWDSFHPVKKFYDPTMNSFNHCSLGCVGEWLFSGLGGIEAIETGFKKIKIKPFIPEELNYAEASFRSMNGIIYSGWKKEGDEVKITIKIPFNTTAKIILPNNETLSRGSGKYEWIYKL